MNTRKYRILILFLAIMSVVVVMCIVQKMTSFEDRYVSDETDAIHYIKLGVDGKFMMRYSTSKEWMKTMFLKADFSPAGIKVDYVNWRRDWSYVPTYFRWLYGGK